MKGRFSRIFELWNQRNTEYYQQVFCRLDKENKTTFNWAAALFGASWMVFRKMYGWAMLYICLYGLTFLLPSVLCDGHTMTMATGIGLLVWFLGLGFFGNTLYYKGVKSKISKGYNKIENYNAIAPVLFLIFIVSTGMFGFFLGVFRDMNQGRILSQNPMFWIYSSLFSLIVIAIFFAIDYKKYHKQESVGQEEVDEKSVHQYLNKAKPKHLGVTLVSVSGLLFVVFLYACTVTTIMMWILLIGMRNPLS